MQLVKYTSLVYGMKSVIEGLFRASRASEFNDPFDCDGDVLNVKPPKVLIDDAVARGTMREYGDPLLNVAMWWEEFRKTLKAKEFVDQHFRIMCFRKYCEDGDKTEPLFWSHYADDCRGLRVILEETDFPAHWQMQNVKYEAELPTCDPSKCNTLFLDPEMMRFVRQRIFTKGSSWEPEEEIRLCIPLDGNMESLVRVGSDYYIKWPHVKIVGVDFGCRVSDDAAKSWAEICRNIQSLKHLKLRKANQAGYEYRYDEL